MSQSFKAKLDWPQQLLAGVIFVACTVLIVGVAIFLANPVVSVSLLIWILVAGLTVWLFLSIRYEVREDGLVSFFGPFSTRCTWDQITRVRKGTRRDLIQLTSTGFFLSPLAPANLVIIERSGGRGKVMASPVDFSGFTRALRTKVPEAGREGIDL